MGKLKIPTKQLAVLYRENAQKIFIFNIIILKCEHHLLLLISFKVYKNASMDTGCFTKTFHLQRDESTLRIMNKIKEAKRQGQRLKGSIKKSEKDKSTKKEDI